MNLYTSSCRFTPIKKAKPGKFHIEEKTRSRTKPNGHATHKHAQDTKSFSIILQDTAQVIETKNFRCWNLGEKER